MTQNKYVQTCADWWLPCVMCQWKYGISRKMDIWQTNSTTWLCLSCEILLNFYLWRLSLRRMSMDKVWRIGVYPTNNSEVRRCYHFLPEQPRRCPNPGYEIEIIIAVMEVCLVHHFSKLCILLDDRVEVSIHCRGLLRIPRPEQRFTLDGSHQSITG